MSLFSVAREKTRSFELELAATISSLESQESKIKNLIAHRRDWYDHIWPDSNSFRDLVVARMAVMQAQ